MTKNSYKYELYKTASPQKESLGMLHNPAFKLMLGGMVVASKFCSLIPGHWVSRLLDYLHAG